MAGEGRRLDPLAEAFAGSADSYDRARPGYEDEPLDWAFRDAWGWTAARSCSTWRPAPASFPRRWRRGAGLLIAVEPLPAMRRLLAARVPEATLLDGTAEQIPMGDGSVDAVFVGEAFHWFDGVRALREIHRVLRPAGGLALIWHHVSWHDRASWAEEFEARLREVPAPDVRPENRPHTLRWQEAFAGNELFTPLVQREFSHPIMIDAEQIVQLVLSWSFVAALPAADRELLGRGPVTDRAQPRRRRAGGTAQRHRRVRDPQALGASWPPAQGSEPASAAAALRHATVTGCHWWHVSRTGWLSRIRGHRELLESNTASGLGTDLCQVCAPPRLIRDPWGAAACAGACYEAVANRSAQQATQPDARSADPHAPADAATRPAAAHSPGSPSRSGPDRRPGSTAPFARPARAPRAAAAGCTCRPSRSTCPASSISTSSTPGSSRNSRRGCSSTPCPCGR